MRSDRSPARSDRPGRPDSGPAPDAAPEVRSEPSRGTALASAREEKTGASGPLRPRVVEAADRFRSAVTGRPWRRRRRRILAAVAALLVLVLGAGATLAVLPQLQVQEVQVTGLGYVREEAVREAVRDRMGGSVLLLSTSGAEREVEAVPGVLSARVERAWPDGMRIAVRERAPVARLTRPDRTTAILDATGAELPREAAAGARLVALEVTAGSSDPDGAVETMTGVLGALPEDLRAGTTSISAGSRSDVALRLRLGDSAEKTIVWGDARDAELKAKVVRALLEEPGTVIDVSSPVAPVTR